MNIPAEDEDFIIEKAIEGWEAELIAHELRKQNEMDIGLREETVEEFLEKDSIQQRIEREKRIQEKKAEVSREDLVRELSEQIDILRSRSKELRDSENDEIGNDTTKNLLKAVRDLADMIDVLDEKDDSRPNVVKINNLEQNFNMVEMVQHLPKEDKKSIAEQLEDDPDVEEFAVVQNK